MAVRARLGLVALLLALGVAAWWEVRRRSDDRDGRRPRVRPRRAELVPGGLGGDDGRDDAPVAGADDRALRTNDPTARTRPRAGVYGRVPARVGCRGRA